MTKPVVVIDLFGDPAQAELRQCILDEFGAIFREPLIKAKVPEQAMDDLILAGAVYMHDDSAPRMKWDDVRAEIEAARSAVSMLLDIEDSNVKSLEFAHLIAAAETWLEPMSEPIPEAEMATRSSFRNRLVQQLHFYTQALKAWDEISWKGPQNHLELALTHRVCKALSAAGCLIDKAPKGLTIRTVQTLFRAATNSEVSSNTTVTWVVRCLETTAYS